MDLQLTGNFFILTKLYQCMSVGSRSQRPLHSHNFSLKEQKAKSPMGRSSHAKLSRPLHSASKISKLSNVGGYSSAWLFNRCICQVWVMTKGVSSLMWSSPVLPLSGFPFLFMANFILLTASPTLFAAGHTYKQQWKIEVVKGSWKAQKR